MAMLDVFSTNEGFSSANLTDSINEIPFVPQQLGDLNLFEVEPINTTVAQVEYNQGLVALLGVKPRGGDFNQGTNEKRKLRSFSVPHIPYEEFIYPQDVQDIRDFGSETGLATLASRVASKLEKMSRLHDYTHEHLRVGAVKGVILDKDGEVIYDLFDEFGIAEPTVSINLDAGATSVKKKALEVIEAVEAALGGTGYSNIRVLCGSAFWSKLIDHASVKEAYQRYESGSQLRADARQEFPLGGVIWERYRQTGQTWIAANEARVVVEGVPSLYKGFVAPADTIDEVNTFGKIKYVKTEALRYGKGIGLYSESNYLPMCTRPGVCVKLATPADPS